MRIAPLEFGIALGACHKKVLYLTDGIKTREVQKAPVEQVIRARFDRQLVQNFDLVRLAVCDVNEARDGTPQVQERVQFDSRLVLPERCPRVNRQAQVDGRGVEGVHRRIQIYAHRIVGVQRSRDVDEVLAKSAYICHGRTALALASVLREMVLQRKPM